MVVVVVVLPRRLLEAWSQGRVAVVVGRYKVGRTSDAPEELGGRMGLVLCVCDDRDRNNRSPQMDGWMDGCVC